MTGNKAGSEKELCPLCQSEVSAGDTVCNHCGAWLPTVRRKRGRMVVKQ